MNSSPHPQPAHWKPQLALAVQKAQTADFMGAQWICEHILREHSHDVNALLDVGALWMNFGFISQARDCFEQVLALSPNDFRASINMANCEKDKGEHHKANALYLALQWQHPNHPMVRRNLLISQQYNPQTSDAERLAHAKAWGHWAIDKAGGPRPRPPFDHAESAAAAPGSGLRVGYVSADFCQHTVGLFIKDVLQRHGKQALHGQLSPSIQVFAYSSGQVRDWVTQEVQSCCTLRDVSGLHDAALAQLIRSDQIDVLVDLSGHTAGSRLTVFAHRPAPVQLSWLGYFATTGLPYIDAVLLDPWHAPEGTEAQFVEDIIRLPGGRLCYQPVPWAPEVAPPPCLKSGQITFGSFNNTGKLNADVYALWSLVLKAVPHSRLVLKWRTLIDQPLCNAIHQAFEDRGIDARRIELRPASFHVDVLKEYADLDIALDPFPFTGGLTSCEALWMGVPVVTQPKTTVVSRQTLAILHAMGMTQWAAKDEMDYVRIATSLASDPAALAMVRKTLRQTMRSSPLMDVDGFTRQLERTYVQVHDTLQKQAKHPAP
jgi:protein O-GlcNAc transferase